MCLREVEIVGCVSDARNSRTLRGHITISESYGEPNRPQGRIYEFENYFILHFLTCFPLFSRFFGNIKNTVQHNKLQCG